MLEVWQEVDAMQDRDSKLKLCPFCGGEAEVWVSDVTDRAIVYCTVCDAQIRIRQNEQEAIEAWNKRVPCDTCAMYFPDDGCMAGLAEGEVAK